jgi:hypothetical protein
METDLRKVYLGRVHLTGRKEAPNAQAQPQRPEGAAEKTRKGASRNRDWRAVCCLWFCAHRVPGAVPAADELPGNATTHWGAVGCSDRLGLRVGVDAMVAAERVPSIDQIERTNGVYC